jgi:hypothetical protein
MLTGSFLYHVAFAEYGLTTDREAALRYIAIENAVRTESVRCARNMPISTIGVVRS